MILITFGPPFARIAGAGTRRRLRRAAIVLSALAAPTAAAPALTLDFPGPATASAERSEPLGSYRLPVGPWQGGQLPSELAEGALQQTAWRVDAPGLTTLQLLDPLRRQLGAAGFTTLFECESRDCGGFDFRYAIDVLPEPDMHVDLGDFRYLAARNPATDMVMTLLVSRTADTGFVQMTRVSPAAAPPALVPPANPALAAAVAQSPSDTVALSQDLPRPPSQGSQTQGPDPALIAELARAGRGVLEDLAFASGSSALEPDSFASLASLAEWLAADPARRVMLVGHTDASGALEANIALSRKRAEAARQRLLYEFGIDPSRVAAEGVGFLSPRAPNDTDEGRARNRRVEVIVTPTQ